MAKRSTLRLGYVIMADDGRFYVDGKTWGAVEGNDMYDAIIFKSRSAANKKKKRISPDGNVFEIGMYNSKPVMLVYAYDYWLDARYSSHRNK